MIWHSFFFDALDAMHLMHVNLLKLHLCAFELLCCAEHSSYQRNQCLIVFSSLCGHPLILRMPSRFDMVHWWQQGMLNKDPPSLWLIFLQATSIFHAWRTLGWGSFEIYWTQVSLIKVILLRLSKNKVQFFSGLELACLSDFRLILLIAIIWSGLCLPMYTLFAIFKTSWK